MPKRVSLTPVPQNKFKLNVNVYEGFATHAELIRAMKKKGYAKETFASIRFLGDFYVVAFDQCSQGDFETAENLFIAGINTAWKTDEKGFMCRDFTAQITPPIDRLGEFNGNELKSNLQIYKDLEKIDPAVKLYRYSGNKASVRDATDAKYTKGYICLLGRTFYSDWIRKEQIPLLKAYFDAHSLVRPFNRVPQTQKINPFQGKLMLRGGATVAWNPYTGTIDETGLRKERGETKMIISLKGLREAR